MGLLLLGNQNQANPKQTQTQTTNKNKNLKKMLYGLLCWLVARTTPTPSSPKPNLKKTRQFKRLIIDHQKEFTNTSEKGCGRDVHISFVRGWYLVAGTKPTQSKAEPKLQQTQIKQTMFHLVCYAVR